MPRTPPDHEPLVPLRLQPPRRLSATKKKGSPPPPHFRSPVVSLLRGAAAAVGAAAAGRLAGADLAAGAGRGLDAATRLLLAPALILGRHRVLLVCGGPSCPPFTQADASARAALHPPRSHSSPEARHLRRFLVLAWNQWVTSVADR